MWELYTGMFAVYPVCVPSVHAPLSSAVVSGMLEMVRGVCVRASEFLF
jgi:hypothetical protein